MCGASEMGRSARLIQVEQQYFHASVKVIVSRRASASADPCAPAVDYFVSRFSAILRVNQ
jgi:hypothetical protein